LRRECLSADEHAARILGIALTEGFDPAQLEGVAKGADAFVIGNVISRGNPLIEAILDAGLPYASGPQWLYENVLKDKWVLAVAGTHGKTTTASMLAWILEGAGMKPGFLIGGVPLDFGMSARLSDSAFFVIEADEYDTAFFDKRSKFIHYRPRTAILNNLEYDHADIFPDLAAIETQFPYFVRTVPPSGRLIVNGEEASLARCARARLLVGGRAVCGRRIQRARTRPRARLANRRQRKPVASRRAARNGALAAGASAARRHNRLNGLAALAAARHSGVAVEAGIEALAAFRGIKRRLEVAGTARGVTVYDDFAHHPTAIATTIEGFGAK
jgi:UDP-N-acetylmuramate: L-alanyl-gamma-D-glutamyl-meso-diaminopimelate ligase